MKRYRIMAEFFLLIAIAIVVTFLVRDNIKKGSLYENEVSVALVSKAVALCMADKETCTNSSMSANYFQTDIANWYVIYMNYLYRQNVLDITLTPANMETALSGITWLQLKSIMDRLHVSGEWDEKSERALSTKVKPEDWWSIYVNLCKYYNPALTESMISIDTSQTAQKSGAVQSISDTNLVSEEEVSKAQSGSVQSTSGSTASDAEHQILDDVNEGVIGNGVERKIIYLYGTANNFPELESWHAYTSDGLVSFDGLSMDYYIDSEITVLMKGEEIITFDKNVNWQTTQSNVWIMESGDNKIKVLADGIYHTYLARGLTENYANNIADIELKHGKVIAINLKKDTVQDTVVSVGNDYVELASYGKIMLTDDYRVYKNYGIVEEELNDKVDKIAVGDKGQTFVMSHGKICGVVSNQVTQLAKIRVLIKTSNYTSLFHEAVSVTSKAPFTVKIGDVIEYHEAGEVIQFLRNSELFSRSGGTPIVITPKENFEIEIASISRAYGVPSYGGTLEIANLADGLIVTNELELEEYLKKVVPSEMPVRYGIECAKVQAICARTYAYKQMQANAYKTYNANVDDSVSFQVYNNALPQEVSTQAIEQTKGEVLTYGEEVISAYYFSTSAGMTTDITAWGSSSESYPYLQSKLLGEYSGEIQVNASQNAAQEMNANANVTSVNNSADATGVQVYGTNGLVGKINLSNESAFEALLNNQIPFISYENSFPWYRWNFTVDLVTLQNVINGKLQSSILANPADILVLNTDNTWISAAIASIGQLQQIEISSRLSSGIIDSIIIRGSEHTILVSKENVIRNLLNSESYVYNTNTEETATGRNLLPSAFFYLQNVYDSNNTLTGYTFIGGGYGHGIGMSQNGAKGMADSGKNYQQILEFFYSGATIKKIY